MYIVTIIAFIAQRNNNKISEETKEEQVKEETTKQEDDEHKNQEETKKEEGTIKDTSRNETIYTNTITQEYTSVEHKDNIELTKQDISLLAISAIFLTITITFLIFFIKNQQNANRKVSK